MKKTKVCRICNRRVDKNNLIKLFTRQHQKILQQIWELTGFTLEKTTGLPEHICQKCEKDAEKAHEFRCRCIKSQAYFNKILVKNLEVKLEENKKNYEHENSEEEKKLCYQIEEALPDENPIDIVELMRHQASQVIKTENSTDYGNDDRLSNKNNENKNDEVETDVDNDIMEEDQDYEIDSDDDEVARDDDENDEDFTLSKKKPKIKPKRIFRDPDLFKNIICDQCGNTYNGRAKFEMHMRRHYGDKRFDCEICSAKYYTQAQLKSHMRIHTGERPFPCKHCERRFKDRSTCKKHERTHTNERPFQCTLCDKKFTTSYVLKNHMLIHTEERSFSCKMCNKFFKRKTHLKTHYISLMHKQNAEKFENSKTEPPQQIPLTDNSNPVYLQLN